jgi:hypothetical protein
MKMVDVTMTMEEYLQLINGLSSEMPVQMPAIEAEPKPKRRASAYSRRYKAAFKKVATRYKLKNGRWKKGGFKAAVRAAHKMAKK